MGNLKAALRCWPTLLVLSLVLPAAVPAAPAAEAEPKPISAAERAAVALARDYLLEGPEAWLDELAPSSPWPNRETARQEIELRAGPAEGARWRLATAADEGSAVFHLEFASGSEEVLRLRLVPEAGRFKIAGLDAGWEEREGAAARPFVPVEAPPSSAPAAPPASPTIPLAVPFAVVLASLLAAWIAFLQPARRLSFGLFAMLLLVAAGWLFWRSRPSSGDAGEGPLAAGNRGAPVAAVDAAQLELRRHLALGRAPFDAEVATALAGPSRLWVAGEALAAGRLDLAKTLLATADLPGAPTQQLLKARLAVRKGDGSGALAAYLELLRLWPFDERFLTEAIGVAYQFGFEKQTQELTAQLRTRHSRLPEALRLLALAKAIDGLPLAGAEALAKAIEAEPSRRSELIASSLEAYLIEGAPELEKKLALAAADEPIFACPSGSQPALEDRAGALATRVGTSLFFEIGSSRLEVPGGCSLAPPQATSLGGEAWLDRRDQALRQGAEALGRELSARGGQLLPAQRRPLAETLAALTKAQNFAAILKLTENLDRAALDALSDEARRAKVQALHRMDRRKEAFDLLLTMVGADFDQNRSDPGALFDFAELMVLEHQYELAIRLFAAADRRLPFPVSGDRRIQLTIEKKLIEKSLHLDRAPFRIYFAADRDPVYAGNIAKYLEKERQRLAAWVPLARQPRQIEVLLLDPRDFSESYGGSGIDLLGLYDGRIRVPLGRLRTLDEGAAALLTHELTHALIAEASGDRAPHWLHEGLAQMVEPGRRDAIAVAEMVARQRWLAFPIVEGALSGMATPGLAQRGYEEALWIAIYLQKAHGQKIFGKLLAEYRQGQGDEDQVFQKQLGMSRKTFDQRLLAWGRSRETPLWVTGPANL